MRGRQKLQNADCYDPSILLSPRPHYDHKRTLVASTTHLTFLKNLVWSGGMVNIIMSFQGGHPGTAWNTLDRRGPSQRCQSHLPCKYLLLDDYHSSSHLFCQYIFFCFATLSYYVDRIYFPFYISINLIISCKYSNTCTFSALTSFI